MRPLHFWPQPLEIIGLKLAFILRAKMTLLLYLIIK